MHSVKFINDSLNNNRIDYLKEQLANCQPFIRGGRISTKQFKELNASLNCLLDLAKRAHDETLEDDYNES